MPRPPRIYLENALYYITSKGDDNQHIFKDDEDFKTFLELLKKYKAQYGFKLFAFCLLPEHFHLLLELPVQKEQIHKMVALGSIMHDLNSSYTKYFNGKYAKKGHLFRERYKAALIEKKPYLLKLTAYIHLNPKRLNLVSHPEQYPYSSYILYLNKEIPFEGPLKEEKEEILSLLEAKDYAQFVERIVNESDFPCLHNDLRKGILGTKDFTEEVRQALASYKKQGLTPGLSFGKKFRIGFLIVIASILGITYVLKLTMEERKTMRNAPLSVSRYKLPTQIKKLLRDLEDTKWQIRLVPLTKGTVQNDIISFEDGKFISHNFLAKNYPASEYFLVIEDDDKIIWESQVAAQGAVAFWRGEIRKQEMGGGLRLRYVDGTIQDFSFVSVGYSRKK
jgi:REP element-mobilizing transposase RayT